MKAPYSGYVFLTLSGGIITASLLSGSPLAWLLAGLAVTCAGIILYFYGRKILGWLILACFIWGGFWFSMARGDYIRQVERNRIFHNREVLVSGTVVTRPQAARNGFRFTLRLRTYGSERVKLPRGQVIVFVRNSPSDDWYGRNLNVRGKFKVVSIKTTGFPDFSEIEKVTGTISACGTPELQAGYGLPPPYIWADKIRQMLTRFGTGVLEPRNIRLLHGIIFGDSLGEADDRFLINLRRTCTIHLLSVSGMHVGFVALTLNFILGLVKIPKRWRVLPLAAGVWFYIMMTGMDPPALRAGIMLMIVLIGDLLKAGDIPLNRLSLAALVLLFMNPGNLFAPSFQLTFAATFGVSCVYPVLVEYFPVRRKYPGILWKALLVSLSAQLMLAPILVQYFHLISWVSPLTNLVLIIPGETAVIGGLAGESIGILWPWLGRQILTIISRILDLIRVFVNWCGGWPWSASWSPSWPRPWLIGYYLGLFLLMDSLRPNLFNQKQRAFKIGPVIIGLLIFLNLAIWGTYFNRIRGECLQVAFIDVGQGDAILIRSPQGNYTLVDGGDEGQGKRTVLPLLRENGALRLERILLTHYHRDHWGGIVEVLKEVPAKVILLPPPDETDNYLEFDTKLNQFKISRKTSYTGMLIELGKESWLKVLEVPKLQSENDRSVILQVSFGKNRLLLTGDLGLEGEEVLLKRCPHRLRAAILKVAHHGSNYATGRSFLSQIRPGLAVISVGKENRFGHPGVQTLNRLRSLGVRVYRTDLRGTVNMRIYRDRILIKTAKGG